MKNYADRGGCYPPKPEAGVDNTLSGKKMNSKFSNYGSQSCSYKNCYSLHTESSLFEP